MTEYKNKKTGFRAGIVPIVLGIVLIGLGIWMLSSVSDSCEFVISAGSFSEEGHEIRNLLETLQEAMDGNIPYSAAVRSQHVSVSAGNDISAVCTVYAVTEGYFDFNFHALKSGRAISGQDITESLHSAVLSEKAAQTFFPGLDPLGHPILLEDLSLSVAGIADDGFPIGEQDDLLIWIPISIADRVAPHSATFEVIVRPSGNETKAMARAALRAWRSDGTWIDGSRLRISALLPLWLSGLMAGICLWRKFLRTAAAISRRRFALIGDRLRHEYASHAWSRVLRLSLPVVFLFLLLAGFAYGLLILAALPLYTFPDWIPETPVDPSSVLSTLKALLVSAFDAVQYRTSSSVTADLSRRLISAGTVFSLVGLSASIFCRRTSVAKGENE